MIAMVGIFILKKKWEIKFFKFSSKFISSWPHDVLGRLGPEEAPIQPILEGYIKEIMSPHLDTSILSCASMIQRNYRKVQNFRSEVEIFRCLVFVMTLAYDLGYWFGYYFSMVIYDVLRNL